MFHFGDLRDTELEYWTKPPNKFFVAKSRESGKVLGCASYKKLSPNTISFCRLAVDQDFRGLKIGEKILLSAIESARKSGFNTMYLTSSETQSAGHHLYKKHGFKYLNDVPNEPQVFGISFEHLAGIKELAFIKRI